MCKKRRSLELRPHPSHILNKRYWDEIRAGQRPSKSQKNKIQKKFNQNIDENFIKKQLKFIQFMDKDISVLDQLRPNF